MPQDPFQQRLPSATDEELTALVEQGPVSNRLGRALVFEEAQITDRVAGFVQSDSDRAFDNDLATVFGPAHANELSAEEATARFGVEGYLTFDSPVNLHRAEEMHRQARLRRYREETAARANLSPLESVGASIAGAMTDPVLLPTWFIGGGSASLRAFGVAPAATRGGQVARGASIGLIDGMTSGVVAEGLNAGVRLSAGEDYDFGDGLRNVLTGAALGSALGGGVGAITRPRPRGAVQGLIAREAEAQGENVATALRIAEIESRFDPRAQNRRSTAGGLFQFLDATWAEFGGGDKLDAGLNARNGVRLLARNRAGLTEALGRPPQEWELYLAHQQGQGGAAALLRDPRRRAVDALREAGVRDPVAAIRLNGGRAEMTAGEFAGKWRAKFGETGPSLEALTPTQPPPATRALSDNERVGAFAEALEAAADDAPLDLAPLLARSGLDALDEASAVPSIRGEWLETDVAVTRGGAEIPVRFAVVELDDLKTSHSDDLIADPDYPQALQPRDRSRAGSVAENFELERDLNPKLLLRDKAASAGAPIVSPAGLVESGNGRVIALRRSARTATEAWGRYAAELKAQGVDVSRFEKPVLVRMRAEPMTGRQRADMAAALNRSQTEAYSPVEQALADARRLDADTVRLIEGDDPFAASNRPFQRAFQARVAPGDKGALTDAAGEMNPAGRERVRAALVQAAYGDRDLTAALFDTADETLTAVGAALADAAPAWSRMRAAAPAHVDPTQNLVQAVHLLRHARASREPTDQVLGRLLASTGLFDGAAVSPETEAFLRMMFRDEGLTRPRGADRLGWALKTYARAAAEVADGPNLFGEIDNAQTIVGRITARLDGAEGAGRSGLAFAGGSEPEWTTREAAPAVLDLRPAQPDGDGPGGGGQRPGDSEPAAAPDRPAGRARIDALIAADPELKALVADTEALAQAAGVDIPAFGKAEEPQTLAEAIRAAAFCLTTEAGV